MRPTMHLSHRHRTIATNPGVFNFHTGNRDIEAFIRLCQCEGMWVLLRPGPYICGEWDLGGIPSYLLSYPDIQLRTDSANKKSYATENRFSRSIGAFRRAGDPGNNALNEG
jgi:beta-galactosidase GanA